jgi:hypothetical protein
MLFCATPVTVWVSSADMLAACPTGGRSAMLVTIAGRAWVPLEEMQAWFTQVEDILP